MATKKRYQKQYKKYHISWSEREGRYIIKNKSRRRVYDTDTVKSATSWIDRNS